MCGAILPVTRAAGAASRRGADVWRCCALPGLSSSPRPCGAVPAGQVPTQNLGEALLRGKAREICRPEMARFRHSTARGGRWCILLVVLCALRAYPIPRLLDAPSPCGGRLPPSLSFRRAPDGSHAACREHAQGPDPVRRLVLRGGGRKLKPKKKSRGGRGAKLRQSHWTTSGLLDTDADSHSNEGPAVSPAGSERQKPRTNELESMIQAATEIASNEEEEDVEEVGLPYQQCTPLTRGHKDIQQPRDAQSYCAEAARCLGRFEIEDAEACYQEALKLQPDAPWYALHEALPRHLPKLLLIPGPVATRRMRGADSCATRCRILNAYGSLLADQGRVEDAVDIFNKSISIDVNNSHVPHLYLGQVMDGQESLSYMRTGVAILEKAEQDCAARQDARAAGAPAPSPDAEPSRDGGPMPMESKAITAALCSARCALGEALLAEDDTGAADEEAEALFRAAMLARPDAPDAHQGLASLRLSQERPQEAGAYMQSVLGILAETRLECLPSIDFRLQSAKLLIGARSIAPEHAGAACGVRRV